MFSTRKGTKIIHIIESESKGQKYARTIFLKKIFHFRIYGMWFFLQIHRLQWNRTDRHNRVTDSTSKEWGLWIWQNMHVDYQGKILAFLRFLNNIHYCRVCWIWSMQISKDQIFNIDPNLPKVSVNLFGKNANPLCSQEHRAAILEPYPLIFFYILFI